MRRRIRRPRSCRTSLIYGGAEPGPQERLARDNRRFFVDEIRSPVQVDDLAAALLELLELAAPGPLHVAGADDVSRFDFAVLLGADPAQLEAARTTPDRAPNVSLDSSRAASMLATRLRGVYEVLSGSLRPALGRSPALGRREEVLERHVQERRLAFGEDLVAVGERGVDVQPPPACLVEPRADQQARC